MNGIPSACLRKPDLTKVCVRGSEPRSLTQSQHTQWAVWGTLIWSWADTMSRSLTFKEPTDLYPNAAFIRAQLAWSYAMKRMYPQALAEYDKIAEPDKAVTAENQLVADGLGWVYAVAGRRDDALKIAREVENLSSHTYVDYYQLATIYAGLGEREEAFRLLEKGYQERSVGMLYLRVDPFWETVHSDPRYADLLRRIGLPQ
jgi:tetratricopeptide (TPR) repeat protein